MTDRDSGECGTVKRASEVPKMVVDAGKATQVQVLIGPDDRADNFFMRRFIMGEGGGIPAHTNLIEHEQYVLCGRAQLAIGDDVHEISAGHVVLIQGGATHWYRVVEAPFEFLCIVPNKPDVIVLQDD